jgi:DNA-binding XRE family transcriptional regulator
MALTNKEKKELALSYFLHSQMSQQEIAARIEVSENTLTAWKQAGDWEVEKGALTATRPRLITAFYRQIELIQASAVDAQGRPRPLDTKEAQAIRMITKSIGELDRSLSIDLYIQVMEEFITWLFGADSVLAKSVLPFLDRFVKNKFAELGK